MKYNQLTAPSHKSRKRVGRGISAGQGKTAGRGTKGQKARAGSSRRPGFEGGQTPLVVRIPKIRGFKSIKPKSEIVNLTEIQTLTAPSISNQTVYEPGLVSSPHVRVKLVGNQEVKKKLNVKLQGASTQAVTLIEKSGGKFEAVPRIGRVAKTKSEKS